MKIALIRRGYSPTGGAEAYLRRLAGGLRSAGHEPVLVTTRHWPEADADGMSIVRIGAETPVGFAQEVRGVLAERAMFSFSLERIGRCDVFRAGDGVHAAWLARRARFDNPVSALFRKWNPKHRQLLRLERETLEPGGATRIIANSEMVAREIRERFSVESDRMVVVPNGIDVSDRSDRSDRITLRAAHGIGPDEWIAMFAGSGWDRKGLRFAVQAVDGLAGVRLVVAGSGRWRGPLPANVQLLGPLRDLSGWFAMADAFVAPTIYDPFSNACLEALAAGLPVLTTDANGCGEILTPGEHGEVLPVGDVAALRTAILRWKDRPDSPRDACRCRAAEFSLDRNVEATLEAVKKLRVSG